ncbi:flagellar basal body-associated FliL family protein [uncultured Roseobacter sp.]|uniref:flagellar basal body-associated FliL family protein n=1 Tax=uncultured Roseobacter sp. TaxID=114847 RepID=UPI002628EBAE|nr:flagellar basal body-associated FliL family protein [uncultured Roseobacter sp.]
MKFLIPLIMLFVGSGAGIGAGLFLKPEPEPVESAEEEAALKEGEDAAVSEEIKAPESSDEADPTMQYVKLSNQFVIPVVSDNKIASMVVVSLNVEVPAGKDQIIYDTEPKIRDAFLRVLFDFANIGGFDGAFTDNNNLDVLRRNLREIAQKTMGSDTINDVLISDIARQDY